MAAHNTWTRSFIAIAIRNVRNDRGGQGSNPEYELQTSRDWTLRAQSRARAVFEAAAFGVRDATQNRAGRVEAKRDQTPIKVTL